MWGASGEASSLGQRVLAEARAFGFDAVGIAAVADIPDFGPRLNAYVAEGRHGDMAWMETTAERRRHPTALWPEVRSVIALGVNYATGLAPLRHQDRPDVGVISVYAQGQDYHDVIKRRLKAFARWLVETNKGDADVKVFVDTAPVMEKPLAEIAGLGWQGKHTNVVSQEHGSWLFLGAIYTTLELDPSGPHANRCGSCTACQAACPTNAFPAPYQLDARRCISYLTIEHKGPIPEEFREAMGNRIYGCDDCLAVCPWNKFAKASHDLAFRPRVELTAPKLADLVQLDDAGFRELFAGSPIKRIGRDRFVRNVLIALGNSGDAASLAAIEPLLADSNEVVREAARWAYGRLTGVGAPDRATIN
jgi:epoxyqueuosine reductase